VARPWSVISSTPRHAGPSAILDRHRGDDEPGERVEPPGTKGSIGDEPGQDRGGKVGAQHVLAAAAAGGGDRAKPDTEPVLGPARCWHHQNDAADRQGDPDRARAGWLPAVLERTPQGAQTRSRGGSSPRGCRPTWSCPTWPGGAPERGTARRLDDHGRSLRGAGQHVRPNFGCVPRVRLASSSAVDLSSVGGCKTGSAPNVGRDLSQRTGAWRSSTSSRPVRRR